MKNKLALITGGSGGIGSDIVSLLSQDGYSIAFTYNSNKSLAEKIVENLRKEGHSVMAFQLNQSERINIQKCLTNIESSFNTHVSILINNAAIAQEKPFEQISSHDWDNMLKTNLQAPFELIQEILPEMVKNSFGRIVNITSVGGQLGGFNQVHYAASKAALINLTRSIAKIYSINGVTCNAVAVGLVQTEMTARELNSDQGKEKVINIPLGRIAKAREISDTVKFLCSNEASYITGQTINLNGGMYFG